MKIVVEFDSISEVTTFTDHWAAGTGRPVVLKESAEVVAAAKPEALENVVLTKSMPEPKKQRKSRARAAPEATAAVEPVTEASVNGNGSAPTVEQLIPRLKGYASKHGAGTVREALTKLGVAKLSQLDEAGRLSLTKELGI